MPASALRGRCCCNAVGGAVGVRRFRCVPSIASAVVPSAHLLTLGYPLLTPFLSLSLIVIFSPTNAHIYPLPPHFPSTYPSHAAGWLPPGCT